MGCSLPFIGAVIGFLIFNVPGAILGMIIGYLFEGSKGTNNKRYRYYHRNNQEQIFYQYLFGLLAKFAAADGAVTREEIEIVDHFIRYELRLNEKSRQEAIRYFDQAKYSSKSFTYYAENLAKSIQYNPNVLNTVMNLLFRLSDVNGGPGSRQEELLEDLQFIFRLSHERSYTSGPGYKQRTGPSRRGQLKQAYNTLNLEPGADKSQVKKKYRELVKQYHPDKIIAKDLPDEFVEVAQKKFAEIQSAYELIMKQDR